MADRSISCYFHIRGLQEIEICVNPSKFVCLLDASKYWPTELWSNIRRTIVKLFFAPVFFWVRKHIYWSDYGNSIGASERCTKWASEQFGTTPEYTLEALRQQFVQSRVWVFGLSVRIKQVMMIRMRMTYPQADFTVNEKMQLAG